MSLPPTIAGHLRGWRFVGALALVVLTIGACATGPVSPDDAADKLRAQALRTRDRVDIIEQLEQVELERAQRANTVLAYKRFLSEFPSSDEAGIARGLLEELRYGEIKRADTELGWETYLEEYPRGKHAAEARTALGAIQIARALASKDIDLVHRTLGLYPDNARRDVLLAFEDELSWSNAQTKGDNQSFEDYLTLHPAGMHRLDALRARQRNDERDMREAEDIDRAKALTERADAGERQRALVAELELARALRTLDFDALKTLAHTHSDEPSVAAVYGQAKSWLESVARHPFSKAVKEAIKDARPGTGLPEHDVVANALFSGDPIDRVAAARELVEWAEPDDIKTFLMALGSDYVSVQIEAIRSLRTLAQALKPAIWKAAVRSREDDVLSRALTVNSWRQAAALREADGRSGDAVNAWQEVVNLDPTDLTARARIFAIAQASKDRLALAASARDLATTAVQFGEDRWQPPDPQGPSSRLPGPGRVFGVSGAETVLRQVCASIDLGREAAGALSALANSAGGSEEQELLTLAGTDAERAISGLQRRREELEESMKIDTPSYLPCGADPSAAVIASARRERADAIAVLGQSADARIEPFLQGLVYSPAPQVKAAAVEALRELPSAQSDALVGAEAPASH